VHATSSDWLAELVANALEANARAIAIEIVEHGPRLEVCVADDGRGMSAEQVRRALDPFVPGDRRKHPSRRVHLGLPLLVHTVRQAGGEFELSSEPGRGTSVWWVLDRSNPDAPPDGDWADAMAQAIAAAAHAGAVLRIRHERDGTAYEVDSLNLDMDPRTAGGLAQLREKLSILERQLSAPPAGSPWVGTPT